MELGRYKEIKEKGAASLQKLGPDTFQIVAKRYDSSTGVEQAPEIAQVNKQGLDSAIKQVEAQMKSLQDALDSLNMLKSEIDAEQPQQPA